MTIKSYLPTAQDIRNQLSQMTVPNIEATQPPTPNLPAGMQDNPQQSAQFAGWVNNDPLQHKRDDLERKVIQKQQQLGKQYQDGLTEDNILASQGATFEEINANRQQREYLQSLDEGARLDNYLRAKQGDKNAVPDKYLENDLNTLNSNQLFAKYGSLIGDYANQQSIQRIQQTNAAMMGNHQIDDVPNNLGRTARDIIGSVVEGAGNLVGGLADVGTAIKGFVTNDFESVADDFGKNRAATSLQELGQMIQSDNLTVERERNAQFDAINEANKERRTQELSNLLDYENARLTANEEAESRAIDNYINNNTKLSDMAQQVPEFIAAAISGGASAAVVKGALALTAKRLGKKVADDVAKKAVAIAATGGIATYSGLREGAGAYGEAGNYIMNMAPEDVASSPQGQRLKQANPELTDKQIQNILAGRASLHAGTTAGLTGFGLGLATAGAERRFGNLGVLGGTAIAPAQAARNVLGSVLGEAIEEGGTGYVGVVSPRYGANIALGEELFSSRTGDLTAGARTAATQGAITAIGSTAVTNANEITAPLKAGIQAGVSKVEEKVKEKHQQTENQVKDKVETELKDTYKGTNFKSMNGKFEDSHLGKAFAETENTILDSLPETDSEGNEISENKAIRERIKGSQYNLITELEKHASEAFTTFNKPNATEEEKANAELTMKVRDELVGKLKEAYTKDLIEGRKELEERVDDNAIKLGSAMKALTSNQEFIKEMARQKQANPQMSLDELSIEAMAKFEPELYKQFKELDKEEVAFEELKQANDSNPILQILNAPSYSSKLEEVRAKVPELDITKKPENQKKPITDILNNISAEYTAKVKALEAKRDNLSAEKYQRLKQELDNALVQSVTNIPTRNDDVSTLNVKEKWSQAIQAVNGIRDLLRQTSSTVNQGSVSSILKAIVELGKDATGEMSNTEALTLYEKYIGSKKMKGLLNYAQDAIKNGGVLPANDIIYLNNFLTSQDKKIGLVQSLLPLVQQIDKAGDKVDFTLSNDEFSPTKQHSREPVKFTSAKQFYRYVARVKSDKDRFKAIVDELLGSDIIFESRKTEPKAKPKQEVKQEVKPKENIKNKAPKSTVEKSSPKSTTKVPVKEKEAENVSKEATQTSAPKKENKPNTINVWYGSNSASHLSNLSKRKFTYEGREYQSVEHAYQTLKSGSFDESVYRSNAWNKQGTKIIGKKGTDTSGARELMKSLIRASFEQNDKSLLLNTGDRKFTHNSPNGKKDYWTEEFPKILEELREEFRQEPTKPKAKEEPIAEPITEAVEDELPKGQLSLFGEEVTQVLGDDFGSEVSEELVNETVEANPDQLVFRFEHAPNIDLSHSKESASVLKEKIGQVLGYDLSAKDAESKQVAIEAESFARARGVSLNQNLLEEYGVWAEGKLIESEKLQNLYKAYNARTKNITVISKAIEDITGKTVTDNDIEFWGGYLEIYRAMAGRLKHATRGSSYGLNILNRNPTGKAQDKEGREYRLLYRLTPVLNFFKFEKKGNGVISASVSPQLVQAMTNAVVTKLLEQTGKTSSAKRMFEELSDGRDMWVVPMTRFSGLTNAEFKKEVTDKNSKLGSLLNEDSGALDKFGELGAAQDKFIQELGQAVLDNLGLRLNGKDSRGESLAINIQQAIVMGLGQDILDEMNNWGWIKSSRVTYLNEDSKGNREAAEYIDFVDFQWNTDFKDLVVNNKGKVNEFLTGELLDKAQRIVRKQWKDLVYNFDPTSPRDFSILDRAVPAFRKDEGHLGYAARILANKKTESANKLIGTKAEELSGISYEKPFRATERDTKGLVATGKGKELIEAVQVHNDIKWTPDTDFFAITTQNRPMFATLFGAVDMETYDSTDSDKEVRRSINNQVNRAFDTTMEIFQEAFDNGQLQDMRFYLKHKMVATQRITIDSAFSPQADKVMRQMAYPVQFKKNEKGELEEHTYTVLINKRPKGEQYSIAENLSWWAQKLSEKSTLKRDDEVLDGQIGTALALAQALGVKIEKISQKDSLVQLSKLLADERNQDVISLVQYMMDVKSDNPDFNIEDTAHLELASRLYERFGTGTPLLAKASILMADMSVALREGKRNVPVLLTMEADGISNGPYNTLQQFNAGMTLVYIEGLKKAGVVTPDLIALAQMKGIPIEEIEGSRYLFSKDGASVTDTYQTVSDNFAVVLQEAAKSIGNNLSELSRSLGKDIFGDKTKLADILNNEILMGIILRKDKDSKNPDKVTEFRRHLDTLGIGVVHETARDIAKGILRDVRNIALTQGLGGIESSGSISKEPLHEGKLGSFIQKVTRGFSKIAVTPANYGGRAQGIGNQINADIQARIKDLAKDIYKATKQGITAENQDKVIESYADVKLLLDALSMKPTMKVWEKGKWVRKPLPSAELFEKTMRGYVEREGELPDSSLDIIRQITNTLSNIPNKDKARGKIVLLHSLGSTMDAIIQHTYNAMYTNVRVGIAANTLLFNKFLLEYVDRLNQATQTRNEENGWVDSQENILDPRAEDSLSAKEIKNILLNMETAPVVATAFSNNETLITELMHSGNTIAKAARLEGNVGKRSIAASRTSQFFYNHNQERKNAQYRTLITTMRDAWRIYAQAGAGALTYEVVATESKTQVETNKSLYALGIRGNNVYDGYEVPPMVRHLVSDIMNKHTDAIHEEHNLMRANFHALNRSGIGSWLANKRKLLDSMLHTIAKGGDLIETLHEFDISINEMVQILDVIAMSINSQSIDGSEIVIGVRTGPKDEDYIVELMAPFAKRLAEDLTQYAVQEKLGNKVGEFKYNRPVVAAMFEIITNLSSESFHAEVGSPTDVIGNAFDSQLLTLRHATMDSHATRKTMAKFFPTIINQFGGISTGYVKNNPQDNELVKRTMDRLIRYLQNDRTGAPQEVFWNFFNTDPEITAYYAEQVRAEGNRLNVATFGHIPDAIPDMKTAEDFLKLDFPESTLLNKSFRALKPLLSKYKDIPVIRSAEEFKELTGHQVNSLGAFTLDRNLNPVIYIKPDLDDTALQETMFHELVHSATDSLLKLYYYKPEALDNTQRAAMAQLENIAKEFAQRYQHDPKVAQELKGLHKDDYFHVNEAIRNTMSYLHGMVANIEFAFSGDTRLSDDELARAKYNTMMEFLAYGSTNANLLDRLHYTGRTEKIDSSIWHWLKNLFKRFRDAVEIAFGFDPKETSSAEKAPRSYLIEMLSLMNIAGDSLTENQEQSARNLSADTRNMVLNHLDKEYGTKHSDARKVYDFFSAGFLDQGNQAETESFETMLSQADISDKHKDYLRTINKTISKGLLDHLNKKSISNYAEELAMLRSSQIASDAQAIVEELQYHGILFSDIEEKMFKLLFATNKANFLGRNEELRLDAEQLVRGLLDNIKGLSLVPGLTFNENQEIYDVIFNNKAGKDNQLAMILALIGSNERVKSLIEKNLTNTKGTKAKTKKLYTDFILNQKVTKLVGSIKDRNIIEQLSIVSASMDFRNKRGTLSAIQANKRLSEAEEKKRKAYEMVEAFADEHIPIKVLKNAIKVSFGAIASGQGTSEYDSDSAIGNMIQDILDKRDYLKGKPTLLSQFIRWFRGAHQRVQYAYRMRAEFTAMSDAVREKLGNVVNIEMEKAFENLTDEKRRAIRDGMMYTRIHTLAELKDINKVNIPRLLTDEKYRAIGMKNMMDEIKEIGKEIGLDETRFTNFIEYQTSGLAELMVTGQAKSANNNHHIILSNTRAIIAPAMLTRLVQNHKHTLGLTQHHKNLLMYVSALTTMKSFAYVDENARKSLSEMFSEESNAIAKVMREMRHTDELDGILEQGNILGSDGYVHNRKNPNVSITVLDPKSKEYVQDKTNLLLQGYEKKAELHNGYEVYRTDQNLDTTYTTGVFDLAEYSQGGVNTSTYRTLGSFGLARSEQHLNQSIHQMFGDVMSGKLKYENHTNTVTTKPIFDGTGSFVGLETHINKAQEDAWIDKQEDGFEGLGNLQARKFEESIGHQANKQHINELRQIYNKRSDKQNFVKIDGKFKPLSQKPSDVVYAKRLNDFYQMLPTEVKNYIDAGGLYIEKGELDNLIGYYKGSILDPLTERSSLPAWFNKGYAQVIAGIMKIEGLPVNPIKALRYTERGWTELVSIAKEMVLIKSLFVPLQNMLSNMIHLVNVGIPMNEIVPLMIEGYRNSKLYIQNEKDIITMDHSLLAENVSSIERSKLKATINLIIEQNNKNPVRPLMVGGMFTSLSEVSETPQEDNPFSLTTRVRDKLKINKIEQGLPKPVSNVLMLNGTVTHTAMMNLMNYGDFVAKYAYYQHLTKTLGKEKDHALNIIRDEFVNYNMNRGKLFDMLNSLGIFWFANYKFGIQKVIYRNLRRNFLRTAAIYASGKYAKEMGIDTVPNQVLGLDYSFYHTDPTNLPEALGSHWLWALLRN